MPNTAVVKPAAGDEVTSSWGTSVADGLNGLQGGVVTVQSGNPGTVQGPALTVVFPRPYAAPPIVVATGSTGSAIYIVNVVGITATQMQLVARRSDGGAQTSSSVYWLAMGTPA